MNLTNKTMSLAAALSPLTDRHFLVAGHTDTVPIRSGRY